MPLWHAAVHSVFRQAVHGRVPLARAGLATALVLGSVPVSGRVQQRAATGRPPRHRSRCADEPC
ncbi:hypothetical protein ACFWFZ_03195 [Streptomyces sp. NPDC060232]|uniref:hypothetical protein n=1 Tax=Streptomyces sp. NPDC060232 TaxID=3347079 RepID=UPI003666AFE4